MLLVLICEQCGRLYNPETHDGIICEDCGGFISITIIPEKGEKFEEEPPLQAS